MKVLKPLRTLASFTRAFDNGGRFWSLWSDAGDGVITKEELAKGGASLTAGRTAVLHFELLRACLPAAEAKEALASLDPKATARWKKHAPVRCSAADAVAQRKGTAVIVECEPVRAEDRRPATSPLAIERSSWVRRDDASRRFAEGIGSLGTTACHWRDRRGELVAAGEG
jgi:hypothetical protein